MDEFEEYNKYSNKLKSNIDDIIEEARLNKILTCLELFRIYLESKENTIQTLIKGIEDINLRQIYYNKFLVVTIMNCSSKIKEETCYEISGGQISLYSKLELIKKYINFNEDMGNLNLNLTDYENMFLVELENIYKDNL